MQSNLLALFVNILCSNKNEANVLMTEKSSHRSEHTHNYLVNTVLHFRHCPLSRPNQSCVAQFTEKCIVQLVVAQMVCRPNDCKPMQNTLLGFCSVGNVHGITYFSLFLNYTIYAALLHCFHSISRYCYCMFYGTGVVNRVTKSYGLVSLDAQFVLLLSVHVVFVVTIQYSYLTITTSMCIYATFVKTCA